MEDRIKITVQYIPEVEPVELFSKSAAENFDLVWHQAGKLLIAVLGDSRKPQVLVTLSAPVGVAPRSLAGFGKSDTQGIFEIFQFGNLSLRQKKVSPSVDKYYKIPHGDITRLSRHRIRSQSRLITIPLTLI